MPENQTTMYCLSCQKSEEEIPLVQLRYKKTDICICPPCMPVLIHHIDRLAEKITSAAENKQGTVQRTLDTLDVR